MLEPSLEKISHYITSNNIALLSVIITVLLYIFTRHSEIRYKKYEDKKNSVFETYRTHAKNSCLF